jgi:hypothetical protein
MQKHLTITTLGPFGALAVSPVASPSTRFGFAVVNGNEFAAGPQGGRL